MAEIGIILSVSGLDIEKKDLGGLSNSDPFLVVSVFDGKKPREPVLWKTEKYDNVNKCVWKNFPIYWDLINHPGGDALSPDVTSLIDFDPLIIFQCFDFEKNGDNQLIGELVILLSEVMNSRGEPHEIRNPNRVGSPNYRNSGILKFTSVTRLTLADEEHEFVRHYWNIKRANRFNLSFRGTGLDKKDIIGSSDPFLEVNVVYVRNDGKEMEPKTIAKTEVIKNNLNPTWDPLLVSGEFCGVFSKLLIKVFDHDDDLTHDTIGQFVTTLHELMMPFTTFVLIHPTWRNNLLYKNSGIIELLSYSCFISNDPPVIGYNVKFRAKNLKSMDLLSKSDPYFIVEGIPESRISYPGLAENEIYGELGKRKKKFFPTLYVSEIYKDDESPSFRDFPIFSHDIGGGLVCSVIINILDYDHKKGTSELIGKVKTNLLELTFNGAAFQLRNKKYKNQRIGILKVENITPIYDYSQFAPFPIAMSYRVKFEARKVKRLDPGITKAARASDPYIRIRSTPYYQNEDKYVYESEVIKNARHAEWAEFILNVGDCGGLDSPFLIECWDYDAKKSHDYIGDNEFTLRSLYCYHSSNMGVPLFDSKASNKSAKEKRRALLFVKKFEPIIQ